MHRVLVVDDDPDTAESFRLLFRAWGHRAAAASDGPSALALAEAFRPEVAFIDVMLPGMDGYEVAHGLRVTPGLEHSLLVAVTGLTPGGGRAAPHGDFDLYLTKPVEPDELRRLLDSLAEGAG